MKARVYRDELELMFRSSKMNEIRTNTIPDFNLQIDNDNLSIIKYLLPEKNKNVFKKKQKFK